MSSRIKSYNSNKTNLTTIEKNSMTTLKNPFLIFLSIYSSNLYILQKTEYRTLFTSIKGIFHSNRLKNFLLLPFFSSISNFTCLLIGRNIINEQLFSSFTSSLFYNNNNLFKSLNFLFFLSLPESHALSKYIIQIKLKVLHTENKDNLHNNFTKRFFSLNRPSNLLVLLFFQSSFSNLIFLYSVFFFNSSIFTASVNSSIFTYCTLYNTLCSRKYSYIYFESKDIFKLNSIMVRSVINYIVLNGFVSKSIIGVLYFNRYFLFWFK